jgi:hypothetical protein
VDGTVYRYQTGPFGDYVVVEQQRDGTWRACRYTRQGQSLDMLVLTEEEIQRWSA